jgi:hypothetical protein
MAYYAVFGTGTNTKNKHSRSTRLRTSAFIPAHPASDWKESYSVDSVSYDLVRSEGYEHPYSEVSGLEIIKRVCEELTRNGGRNCHT